MSKCFNLRQADAAPVKSRRDDPRMLKHTDNRVSPLRGLVQAESRRDDTLLTVCFSLRIIIECHPCGVWCKRSPAGTTLY
jgi:hypothetical protein